MSARRRTQSRQALRGKPVPNCASHCGLVFPRDRPHACEGHTLLIGDDMDARKLETMVREALPEAEVEAIDLQGGDHFELTVVSDCFETMSLVARHRMVYSALGDAMHGEIHALTLRALTRAEAEREQREIVQVQRR